MGVKRGASYTIKASVAWNNSFRRTFSCCWRERSATSVLL